MVVSDATDVIFGMRCVLGDRVGLNVRRGDRDKGGGRFLGKSESERLIDGFWGGDSGGGDEGDGDGRVNGVRHDG